MSGADSDDSDATRRLPPPPGLPGAIGPALPPVHDPNAGARLRAPSGMRWSNRPVPGEAESSLERVPRASALGVLLRWTEDLDDERAVTLWAGLSAVEDPTAREAAILRWIEWAGVTIPLGVKFRDLALAVEQLIEELEATTRNADRVYLHDAVDLLPMTRALHGYMRARENVAGVVAGAARAIVLAREVLHSRGVAELSAATESGRVSTTGVADPAATGHLMLVATLRRRMERAATEECAELIAVYLRAERPVELPLWAQSTLDFLLLHSDYRGVFPRALGAIGREAPGLWTALLQQSRTFREAVRAGRLLIALAQHEDIARDLPGVTVQVAEEVLIALLEHDRFEVWSRAARAMGRLAGVLPSVGQRLQGLFVGEAPTLLKRRAYAALGNLSLLAAPELHARRNAIVGGERSGDALAAAAAALLDSSGANAGESGTYHVPEAALVAALSVGLSDLAADGSMAWVEPLRSFIPRGGPEAWMALGRTLQEIRQRDPGARGLVEILAQDLRARAEAWKGPAGIDAERAERAAALAGRVASSDESRTPFGLLYELALLIGKGPGASGLRAQVDAFAAEMDILVGNSARALGQENPRTAARGAMVLEEIVDLVVQGDLEVIAYRIAEGGPRAAALSVLDALRQRLLKMLWTGLRRPTPQVFAWRRWLLRTAATLPLVPSTNRRIAAETVREQVFETLDRLADDPNFGHAAMQRYVASAVVSLSASLRPALDEGAPLAVLVWLSVRGALLPSQVRMRRWLGDEVSPEAVERLFRVMELMGRTGRDIGRDLHELSVIAGGEKSRMGNLLEALGAELTALAQRRAEAHWSGLPRFDLTDLANYVDTLRRVRDESAFALTLDAERPNPTAPTGQAESLAERAGRLDRMLTATSLKFVDASRRVEVVEHYVSEVSALSEAIAVASGPLVGAGVRVLLAKALVQVRALAADAMRDREGVRYIARLRVLGELSSAHEGGIASTYLAEGPAPGKRVVVKLLPWTRFRGASAEMARQMFEGEMERLAAVVHPNIVSIVDAGFVEEGAYIALEYIPGASLETLLQKLGRLPLAQLGPLVADIARALAYLHDRGVLHRDVKPANLLAQADLPHDAPLTAELWDQAEVIRAVLIDFGVATEAERAGPHEGVTGTPGYIAPEVARGLDTVGPAVDVYSLAVVVYELLTGTNPFLEGHADLNTILVRHGSMTLPWARLPEVPGRPMLVQLLSDATRFDPRQRPTMREFLTRWTALLAVS